LKIVQELHVARISVALHIDASFNRLGKG